MTSERRIVVITGGARGLGYAAAEAFAEDGAIVVVNDLRADAATRAAERLGARHQGLGGDVSSEQEMQDFFAGVIERWGRIDVLVNNAGLADSFVPTIDQTYQHWQKLIDVNLNGTFLCSQIAARHMMGQGTGAIVNISSLAGVVGLPVRTAYSASKAGVEMLTRVLAAEWAPNGLRVNAVAPGYIMTSPLRRLIDEGKVDELRIRKRTPMGRLGEPRDIADAAVFLASAQARFITGVTLLVDGGYAAWGAPGDAFPADQL